MNYSTESASLSNGHAMYDFASALFPICRSLTGDGVRETLRLIAAQLPGLEIKSLPSGTPCFDWTIPNEWNIREAYILDPSGQKILDFADHNLHVVGYSIPIDRDIELDELQLHLHSLPEQPDAIPYVTSYYSQRWGFCMTERQRRTLQPGRYHAVIRSSLDPGKLNYGELILPGTSSDEILLSTYICHPSMANNEISGPVVTTALSQWIQSLGKRHYTYRIVFVPETIGAIAYLSLNLAQMKSKTRAGFVVTCVGDDRTYSFLPSRLGNTLADRVALHVLKHHTTSFKPYTFLDRGSDERQYCSIGVDLPVASVMRSKYGEYPEYHTSLDDLSLISPEGLNGAYEALCKCLAILEGNRNYKMTSICEPQLGRRGLYPQVTTKESYDKIRVMADIIAYADGEHDLIQLAERVNASALECLAIILDLEKYGLVRALAAN